MSDCGTNRGYRRHIRTGEPTCDECRRAHNRYEKRRRGDQHIGRTRMMSAVGTKRRIQALVALGWTYPEIGKRLGVSSGGVYKISRRHEQVLRAVAARMAKVYDQMSMTLPPTETRQQKRDAAYARTVARKHGWVPPLAWDDIDLDTEPKGMRGEESKHRRDVATWEDHDELLAQGYTRGQIADRLGMTKDALEHALARRAVGIQQWTASEGAA